jgi:DNA-binding transcriptional regulator YdaS (Cro superfamily)
MSPFFSVACKLYLDEDMLGRVMARPISKASIRGKVAVYDRLEERYVNGQDVHTVTELARRLGVTKQALSGWRQVPGERVLKIEALIGLKRWVMRPDLYPPPKQSRRGMNGSRKRTGVARKKHE